MPPASTVPIEPSVWQPPPAPAPLAAGSSTPLLTVRAPAAATRLRRNANQVPALFGGAELCIGGGELVGMLGETHSGKSVSLRALLGLPPPNQAIGQAELELAGAKTPFSSAKAAATLPAAGVAYIPQDCAAALHPALSIARQLGEALQRGPALKTRRGRGPSRKALEAHSIELLARVGIDDPQRTLKSGPQALAAAETVRVALALALAANPRLIVADDPTFGLDGTAAHRILDTLVTILIADGIALLLATSDPRIVAQYCDHVLVLHAGRIVESGPVKRVIGAPAHPYTKALLDAVAGPGAPAWVLRGRSPAPLAPLAGCPFRERCEFAHAPCGEFAPPLRNLADETRLACHLIEGVSAHVAAGL
jgi:oligopeptide/dipeptide ABC transporter ATP-binding protein